MAAYVGNDRSQVVSSNVHFKSIRFIDDLNNCRGRATKGHCVHVHTYKKQKNFCCQILLESLNYPRHCQSMLRNSRLVTQFPSVVAKTCSERSTAVARCAFSTVKQGEVEVASSNKETKDYKFYDGFYSDKLKMLRRISISSSILSLFGLPVVISLSTGDLSTAAKVSIASTAVVASLGSTAILHAITHPYVTSLSYVAGGEQNSSTGPGNYRFRAVRLNMLGNPKTSEFSLDEMKEVRVTNHPYANFQINGKYYYVRHEAIDNEELRDKISARCTKKGQV